ncbi:MAG TPA: OmpW family outer membrane protein, partial [Gammaproteobacteria bacterium]
GPLKTAGYTDLDVDDALGLALQAGIDFDVTENWFVTADVRWVSLETDAEVTGGGNAKIEVDNITIDPWVYSLMIGTRF